MGLAYAEEEEAGLEGGMVDAFEETEEEALGVLVESTRQMLMLLVEGISPSTASRALAQISKVANHARLSLSVFDPDSGVELEGLPSAMRTKVKRQRHKKNRETTGVEAMKHLAVLVGSLDGQVKTRELKSVLDAAKSASASGEEEMAESLRARARELSDEVVSGPDISSARETIGSLIGLLADSKEGFGPDFVGFASNYIGPEDSFSQGVISSAGY